MAESIVTLRVEARNAISSLNRTSQATKTLSRNANGATKSLAATSTATRGLGAAIATSLGPLLTLGAAFATVSNAVGTFTARERDVEILRQGLVNLGEGTVALNSLQEAADRLGNQTLFNQEEFTRGFNLLTSFRNIGVDAYERVAQAAADIAQVNQVDVSTSFMQLAKALQDPERNLSNLNRSGIAFTKTQTELIKELMKTGKTAEAHAEILRIVEESYNGLAQAAGEGLAGDVDALGETFRDFSETLGKALEPALIASVKGLTELIKTADDLINSPLGKTAAIFSGIALAAKGLPVLLTAISTALMKVAAAGGVATIALNALPFVALATAAGIFTTALIKTNEAKKEFNDLVNTGAEDEVTQALRDQAKIVGELNNQYQKASGRDKKAIKRKLDEAQLQAKMLEGRLQTLNSDKLILESATKIKEENIVTAEVLQDINEKSFSLNTSLSDANSTLLDTNNILNDNNFSLGEGVNVLYTYNEEANELKQKFDAIGKSVEQNLVQNLTDAVMGAQTFGQALTNVLQGLQRQLIEMAMQQAVSGLFGGMFGNFLGGIFGGGGGSSIPLITDGVFDTGFDTSLIGAGAFANGGNPPVGKVSLVGEKGPELFVPQKSGTIIPNHALGGTTNNVVVNVDATGSNVEGDDQSATQLGEVIAVAVQQELIKQQMSGGLLN